MVKKVDINTLLERIESLESRLDKLDPISKRKLPSKKDQIEDIKNWLKEKKSIIRPNRLWQMEMLWHLSPPQTSGCGAAHV